MFRSVPFSKSPYAIFGMVSLLFSEIHKTKNGKTQNGFSCVHTKIQQSFLRLSRRLFCVALDGVPSSAGVASSTTTTTTTIVGCLGATTRTYPFVRYAKSRKIQKGEDVERATVDARWTSKSVIESRNRRRRHHHHHHDS